MNALEKFEPPWAQNGATNGYHPHSIDVIEDDIETSEFPSMGLAEASAVDLKRESQSARKKKFYDKFQSIAAVAVVILAVGWISYAQPGTWLVLAVLFICL